ncbi:MAG: amino acid adenylation domain-containing protein, partial [bacterium]|nr:amino acid adenylation domain-containing protein [bacterium]
SVKPTEKKDYYPLTPIQKRFFIFQQLNADNISYNIYEVMELRGQPDKNKFRKIFKRLIQRHESLRTSFHILEGEPVQKIHAGVESDIEIRQLKKDHLTREQEIVAEIVKDFVKPFELSRAPLIRARLTTTEPDRHYLAVDIHHIIADGTAIGLVIKDFLTMYQDEPLPPLKIQFKDYTTWYMENEKSGRRKSKKPKVFEKESLELPTDYLRPAELDFSGDNVRFEIEGKTAQAIRAFAIKEDASLFVILLTAYNILLAKLTGQENIIVGSPMAGRSHVDFQNIIGLFLNTLVLRNYPAAEKTTHQLLTEVKDTALTAFDNQDFQYEELLEMIKSTVKARQNPLFDVMFALQNMAMPEIEIAGLKIKRKLNSFITSKFDMTLYCEEIDDKLYFDLEYSTQLFKRKSIERYTGYYLKILEHLISEPNKKIAEIEILTEKEKHQLLYRFNDTNKDYPSRTTIYNLFENQAAATPENIALIAKYREEEGAESERSTVTYNEFNENANRLARVLRRKGVVAGTVVGIMIERSIQLMEAIYAVLKAGGTYLPTDPEYPAARIQTMLKESKAALLITGKTIYTKKKLDTISQEIVMPDESAAEIAQESPENLQHLSGPENLIYIIFTSGSTGVPKGAGVYHRSFVNMVNWFVKDYTMSSNDTNLLMTSFSFDLTQKNLYAPLLLGGTLCIPAVNYFDPSTIVRDIHEKKITWINCTPSMFFQLIEYCRGDELKKLETLRYVYLGGEPLSIPMFLKWLQSPHCHGKIVNTYGPTECTDISNSYIIEEPADYLNQPVPVGKPIYNVKLYVLDKNRKPVPVGIPGELCIGGESVGIGYVNDELMTVDKFITYTPKEGEPAIKIYRTGDRV